MVSVERSVRVFEETPATPEQLALRPKIFRDGATKPRVFDRLEEEWPVFSRGHVCSMGNMLRKIWLRPSPSQASRAGVTAPPIVLRPPAWGERSDPFSSAEHPLNLNPP